MTRVRARGEDVRRYILENVEKNSGGLTKVVSEHFGITRQGVNKHLRRLLAEGAITQVGQTRNRVYKLRPLTQWKRSYQLTRELAEDVVWREDVAPELGEMPENVKDIWHYGFTEIFNNAIDHSDARWISVEISKTAASTEMIIWDDGVGIFKKIQTALGLLDVRHSVLELAKGKFTTDPARHSGEGIFFTWRMFDAFEILSAGAFFSHKFGSSEDWILDASERVGTFVRMRLHNHTARTTKRVFDQYTSDFGFTKTVVPVELVQYGDDKLVSRSQAKRLLVRVELFKTVVFDFTGVATIGQAFADEIFRVFTQQHPNMEVYSIHENSEVKRMIERVKSGSAPGEPQAGPFLPGLEPPNNPSPQGEKT